MLTIFLLISTAFAEMPQHYTPWPPNGTIYLDGSCPGPCYPLVENGQMLDLEVLDLVDEPTQIPNPEFERQLQRLRDEGSLEDGSTVTTAPAWLPGPPVKRLRESPEKVAAKEARLAAEAQAEAALEAAKAARVSRLKSCGSASTVAALRACVLDLIEQTGAAKP